MAPQPNLIRQKGSWLDSKWVLGCLFLITTGCGTMGCLFTVWLYTVNDRWPRRVGNLPWGDVANALLYLVPMVTAVAVIGTLLTLIGLWFLQAQAKDNSSE